MFKYFFRSKPFGIIASVAILFLALNLAACGGGGGSSSSGGDRSGNNDGNMRGWSGSGTSDDPYLITTVAGPYKFLKSREIVNIYANILKIEQEMIRGEFEKKQDYENRIKNTQKAMPFTIEIPINKPKYDVDKEEFTLAGKGTFVINLHEGGGFKPYIELHKEQKIAGEYIGQNTFGVKKTIKKEEVDTWHIIVANNAKKAFTFIEGSGDFGLWFNFKCEPDAAKNMQDTLVLIAEFVPIRAGKKSDGTPSYINIRETEHSPTISEPYDIRTTKHYIHAEMRKGSVVNRENGEVVYSFEIK